MSDLHTWDTTAANNNSSPPDGFPENMAYSAVNNAAREVMAAAAKMWGDIAGGISTAGSSNAYTLTPTQTFAAYGEGMLFLVEANHTNTGAATLNVNSLGAKDIKDGQGNAVVSGEIVSGARYFLAYDNGAGHFRLVAQKDSGTFTNATFDTVTINDGLIESVEALSGTTPEFNTTDGSINTWTLSGNSTPTDGLSAGGSLTLLIDDGTASTITWPTMEWAGGSAPSLPTSGYAGVELFKVGSTLYGAYLGDFS